jgi:hypothetical protein
MDFYSIKLFDYTHYKFGYVKDKTSHKIKNLQTMHSLFFRVHFINNKYKLSFSKFILDKIEKFELEFETLKDCEQKGFIIIKDIIMDSNYKQI